MLFPRPLLLLFGLLPLAVLGLVAHDEWTDADIKKLDAPISAEQHRLFFMHAPWCKACSSFKPVWAVQVEKLANDLPELDITVVSIDISNGKELAGRFLISHIPTIFHQHGREFRKIDQYRGRIVDYFTDKEWKRLPPLSAFSDPTSRAGQAAGKAVSLGTRIADFAKSMGMTPVFFALWVSIISSMILFFTVWVLWLITDYRLKRNLLEDEAHQRAVYKALHPDSDWSDKESDSDEPAANDKTAKAEAEAKAKAETPHIARQRPNRRASS